MYPCALCGATSPQNTKSAAIPEPTSFDRSRGCSCRGCGQVEELEREIDEARRHLESLIRKRPQMKYYQNAEHDLLVRRLPRELISRVFQFCLVVRDEAEVSGDLGWYDAEKHTSTPFELAGVSQMWRSIALSTPQLWTHLAFFLRTGTPVHGSGEYREFIKKYLSRSGSLPIYLVIHAECAEKSFEPTIRLFNTQCHRWRSLFLRAPFELVQRLVGTSILNTLYIDYHCDQVDGHILQFPKAAPKIVTLEGAAYDSLCINWAGVTQLTLGYCASDGIFDLFRSTTQLECLKVSSLFGISEEQVLHSPVITLPNLHTLIIEDPEFYVDMFFKPLNLPALSSLSLSGLIFQESLAHRIEQWSCTIHHLSIQVATLSPADNDLIPLMKACRSLETFKLGDLASANSDIRFRSIFGSLLKEAPNTDRLLPNLQTLHYKEYFNHIPWSSIPLIFCSGSGQLEGRSPTSIDHSDNSKENLSSHAQRSLNQRRNLDFSLTLTQYTHKDFYIPKDAISALLMFREQGFKLKICRQDKPDQDFLLASAEHFGMFGGES